MFQVMHSMELDDEERYESASPVIPQGSEYPYGLRICITDKELAKLDLDPEYAERGGLVHGHFLARITSVTHHESGSRIEMQIENLAIESEDEEDDENEEEVG